jgi:uncharacterized protein YdgA (DUF945 family)
MRDFEEICMSRSVKIAIAASVLALLVFGGNYGIGLSFKSKYLELTEQANQELQKNPGLRDFNASFQVENYESGIFGATAQTRLTFTPLRGKPFSLVFKDHIRHGLGAGLSLGKVRAELEMPQEIAEALRIAFGEDPFAGKSPLVIDSAIGWTGKISGHIESPRFAGKAKATEINWGGINGDFTGNAGNYGGVWSLEIPGLSVRDESEHVEISHLRGKGNSARANGRHFYTGLGEVSVDKFIYKKPEAERLLEVENVKVSTEVRETDGAVDFIINYAVGKMLANDKAIDAVSLTIALEKLDADALDAFVTAMETASQTELPTALLGVATQHSAAILRRKPVLAIRDSSLKFKDGSFQVNARLSYTGEKPEQFNAKRDLSLDVELGVTRALLAQEFSKKAREELAEQNDDAEGAAISEQLVDTMVEQKIAELTGTGYVADKDGALTTTLHMQGETLTLNGKQLEDGNPLSALSELGLPF